jgi:hypothetical protein
MNIAFLIGRIILGLYWLMAGFNHFKDLDAMSEYAKAKGTPSPKLAVKSGDRCSGHLSSRSVFPDPQLLEDG